MHSAYLKHVYRKWNPNFNCWPQSTVIASRNDDCKSSTKIPVCDVQYNSIWIIIWSNHRKFYGTAFHTHPFVSGLRASFTNIKIVTNRIYLTFWFRSLIGYHLIAYIRAWQNALNATAVQNGFLFAFRFNSYIISVLVIFYLQLDYNFPKLADVPSSQLKSLDHVPPVDGAAFKQAVCKFFEFYGRKYEKCKLISLTIGRWQNVQANRQVIFTTEQKLFVWFGFLFRMFSRMIFIHFPFDLIYFHFVL